MTRTLLKLVLFGALCLLIVEQSYRVYVAGWLAFDPWRFDSYNQIVHTELIRLSEYPEIYYELKPDLDAWFKGHRLRTNSVGLADREYPLAKPPGTFRVAVVGSSWTMATGVDADQTYHALLEERLNAADAGRRYEFVNFGVELYGLREIVGTVRHRVLAWEPDLILVGITAYTSSLLWEEPAPDQALPETTHPFFQMFSLRALSGSFGLAARRDVAGRPRIGRDARIADAQVVRAMHEIDAIADAAGVPAAVMWLSFGHPGPYLGDLMESTGNELGITYIKVYERLQGKQEILRGRVGRADRHPNPESHRMMADKILEDLNREGLLPGV